MQLFDRPVRQIVRFAILVIVAASGLVILLTPAKVSGQTTRDAAGVVIGSKAFTESVILADIATHLATDAGHAADHRRSLGGTQVLFNALVRGDIDVYPEYTGTLTQEVFAGEAINSDAALRAALASRGLAMTAPLGFNNTYAIGMPQAEAAKLGIATLSDLRNHPSLRLGFSNEFLDRGDGWPALKQRYGLPHSSVTGLDHDLAYRALVGGDIAATDLYSTDAEIRHYDLRVLRDDLNHFPRYEAVYLYRIDLAERAPRFVAGLDRLSGRINESTMIALNARAKLEKTPEPVVAAEFLADTLAIDAEARPRGRWESILDRTGEHLRLVGLSLGAAIAVAVPLGVVAARYPMAGRVILGVVAAIYTIPSLALLVFMIPLLGIGTWPAVVALFLYSLLPIVRNTHAGLVGISGSLRESAEVLGLSGWTRLIRIDLPLASPAILAGVQTSAVINVGTATLGALIGAGGYGQPILTGIRLDDTSLILSGAVPAALLALAVQAAIGGLERLLIPRGLRLDRRRLQGPTP